MGAIIFMCIFFGIVGFLVILAIWGSRKDKTMRQREVIKRKREDTVSSAKHTELYLKLYFLVLDLDKKMKEFDPSTGTYTMGDINKNFSQAIVDIKNSTDIQDVFLFEERKAEFKPIIDELTSIKPSKWETDSNIALNLIRSKSEFMANDPKNEDIIKIANEWVKIETEKE